MRAYGVPLGAAGFAVSCVMLPGALAGWSFGAAADRHGAKRVAIAGLIVAGMASLLAGFSTSFSVLIILRVAEGVGYTLLVVAATVIAARIIPGRSALALSVWSSFAPIGFALGQWAGAFAPHPPLQPIGVVHAAALGLAAFALYFAVPAQPAAGAQPQASIRGALRHAPAQRTAAAFGGVCAVLLAAVALAPVVLATEHEMSVADAASFTALAALPSIVGRIIPGWLLGRGAPAIAVFIGAAALAAATLVGALVVPFPLSLALVLFAVFQVSAGALPALLSAMLPHVAPAPAQLGTVSGMCSQSVNVGNLVGPPLALAIYAAAGTGSAVLAMLLLLGASMAVIAPLRIYHRDLRGKGGHAA